MKWSVFNHLFKSKQHGWLLYNAAANSFAQLDENSYEEIIKIQEDPDKYNFSDTPDFYIMLRNNGNIVEETQDDDFRNIVTMTRMKNNYENGLLTLTIVPTRACNFDCVYCYEKDRDPIFMNKKVEEQLFKFVKGFKSAKVIQVTWYGGEPLLCFKTIKSLTEQFLSLDIKYNAQLVTNGYLLDDEKIDQLKDLKINFIQIILDGPEQIHNQRRPLIHGKETYQKIMENIKKLNQKWDGTVAIRVNIDQSNRSEYYNVSQMIENEFQDSYNNGKIYVYPGIVHDHDQLHPDIACFRDRIEEAAFNLEQYEKHGIKNFRLFPSRSWIGCIALRKNGFVIGPEGEVYKCWEDVGVKEHIIGSIFKDQSWNNSLVANYMVGGSYLHDPECQNCFYYPVCDGGCPAIRLRNHKDGTNRNVCLKFKGFLEELLEIHFEKKIEMEKKDS